MCEVVRCNDINFDNLSLFEQEGDSYTKRLETIYNKKPVYFQCLIKLPKKIIFNRRPIPITNNTKINIELFNFITNYNNKFNFEYMKDNRLCGIPDHVYWENMDNIFCGLEKKAIFINNNGISKQEYILNDVIIDNKLDYDHILTFSIKNIYNSDTKCYGNIFNIFKLERIRSPTKKEEATFVLQQFFNNILLLPPFKNDKYKFTGGILYKRSIQNFEKNFMKLIKN